MLHPTIVLMGNSTLAPLDARSLRDREEITPQGRTIPSELSVWEEKRKHMRKLISIAAAAVMIMSLSAALVVPAAAASCLSVSTELKAYMMTAAQVGGDVTGALRCDRLSDRRVLRRCQNQATVSHANILPTQRTMVSFVDGSVGDVAVNVTNTSIHDIWRLPVHRFPARQCHLLLWIRHDRHSHRHRFRQHGVRLPKGRDHRERRER